MRIADIAAKYHNARNTRIASIADLIILPPVLTGVGYVLATGMKKSPFASEAMMGMPFPSCVMGTLGGHRLVSAGLNIVKTPQNIKRYETELKDICAEQTLDYQSAANAVKKSGKLSKTALAGAFPAPVTYITGTVAADRWSAVPKFMHEAIFGLKDKLTTDKTPQSYAALNAGALLSLGVPAGVLFDKAHNAVMHNHIDAAGRNDGKETPLQTFFERNLPVDEQNAYRLKRQIIEGGHADY